MSTAKHTPLYSLHRELGAKETVFGGYLMPLSYPGGALQEHRHTRAHAGLFDISHMGQANITVASGNLEKVAAPFTGDVASLPPGEMIYTLMTNEQGGIHDDVILARLRQEDTEVPCFHITFNAGGKAANLACLATALNDVAKLRAEEDKALLALQGPEAAKVLERLLDCSLNHLHFMQCCFVSWHEAVCLVARCGYTGEDGFEISIPASHAVDFARAALACGEVEAVGLAARDSLRLEAGLCLYGQDIDACTTPIEAGLARFVSKRRREQNDFPGSMIVLQQLQNTPPRHLVGLMPQDKALLRPQSELLDDNGQIIGEVTSGGFGASFGGPIALGYVSHGFESPRRKVFAKLRGREITVQITDLPFVPHNYRMKSEI